jgi:NAD(P)-dependent dehydrogenase (short-subunit alcohol dehydrogenase family)
VTTFDFTNKRVVITGGERGIGRACVERFETSGATAISLDLERAGNDARARFYACDVSRSKATDAVFEQIASDVGDIDYLINNAGIQHYGSVTTTSEDDWDRVLNVNLKSAYLCARRAIPMMQRRGSGVIVNVSSVQAYISQQSVAPYTTSKTALLGLTRSIAVDYAPQIRCVAVCPGTVDTPMLRWSIAQSADPAAVMSECEEMHLSKRISTPQEIAGLIAYLCSDEAGFITGQAVRIDGGLGVMVGGSKRS